jgi:hypothetical protein
LANAKEMLDNEVDELKWRLEKEMEKYQTMSARNRELN